ncbi:MAG: DUF4139 domain-containing protein [Alphaproteobacteria bacterium]|nr:DUF4139 domain-containing protein [Alphaproteobacteria bacterium]
MKRQFLAMAMALGFVATLQQTSARAQETPDLKRVVLSTGGVAYMEYEVEVDGDAEIIFAVRLDQVDDVLKSFIVLDDAGGVGAVSLPGRQPLTDVFRDLPFSQTALASPVALLQALTGEGVEVSGPVEASGRILSVARETVAVDGATLTHHRLTLATDTGLIQIVVEDARSIRFIDPEIEIQVAAALVAIAEHRVQDRRTLTLVSAGQGKRLVRLGYVVAAPLWKTTYRLALNGDDTALLQGWATLENMSGQDWDGVELTLVSGNPVTFRQALYQSYWVQRLEVPVDVAGRVLPGVDQGTVGALMSDDQRNALLRSEAEADMMLADTAMESMAFLAEPAPGLSSPSQLAGVGSASGEDAATQVVFRIDEPVTVTSGESLSVPIISRTVEAEPVGLYQPSTSTLHPLASVRLVNDSGLGLPPGVLTIYQPSEASGGLTFVGDARLGVLPDGDERLLSFALDQKTLVERDDRSNETITTVRIDRGVMSLTISQRRATAYAVEAPAGDALNLLIEHPKQYNWDLVMPVGEIEATQTHYRIPLQVPAGEVGALAVVMEAPRYESMRLVDLYRDQVLYYAENSELPDDVREAFAELAGLRGDIEETQRAIDELERQRQLYLQEQERLRDNLQRVPSGSDLAERYLEKLGEQEDGIEALLDEMEDLREALGVRQAALSDFIADLNI